jgi:tRNA pseudouridine55 synthase
MELDDPGGFLSGKLVLIDKPYGWTSFDVVNKVRLIIRSEFGIRKIKVGHAGTLDPLATGLMILLTGRATRRTDEFKDLDKEYIAEIELGKTTPSYDLETEVDKEYPIGHITDEKVKKVLTGFLGFQDQVPPIFSAKFIDGKRAYVFARKGEEKVLEPVKVNFREIELLNSALPELKVRVLCSKGTYIRSLARDIGEALGSGAYLKGLQRTAIGNSRLSEAMTIEEFEKMLKDMKQT